MWMQERRRHDTYPDQVLAARVLGSPLHCSQCKHPREKHGSLAKKILAFEHIPDGGRVLVEYIQREKMRKRERRFEHRSDVKTEGGPKVEVVVERVGEGMEVKSGDVVRCHYDAFLKSSMERFETSREGRPIEFTMGMGRMVAGWEMGMKGVRPGAKRRVTVPPELAYGGQKVGGERNATVVFVIEVLAVDAS